MPAALEAGTLNGHGIAGLHAALSFIEEVGVEAIHGREMKLMRKFHDGVKEIPGVRNLRMIFQMTTALRLWRSISGTMTQRRSVMSWQSAMGFPPGRAPTVRL